MSTTTFLSNAEAVVGRLPPTARVFTSLRDFTLVDIQLPNLPLAQRVCCVWDFDRDIRQLLVLSALILMNRSLCADLIGLAESKGVLRSFWASGFLPANYATPLQVAADAALEEDHWTIAPPEFVTLNSSGQLDVSMLPANHPLRIVPPHLHLGRQL
jgi:hypothetical protein